MKFLTSDIVCVGGGVATEHQERSKPAAGVFASDSELNSWRQLLPHLASVLPQAKAAVQECKMFLEFGMPGSNCRADAVLVGLDRVGLRSVVVVEVKQWNARSVSGDAFNVRHGG